MVFLACLKHNSIYTISVSAMYFLHKTVCSCQRWPPLLEDGGRHRTLAPEVCSPLHIISMLNPEADVLSPSPPSSPETLNELRPPL